MLGEDPRYTSGQRVRVTQQIPRQTGALISSFEGTIVSYTQQRTGSWFAHSKDHKLWLDRLELRKDDGEIVVCNLDQYTSVELVEGSPSRGSGSPSRA